MGSYPSTPQPEILAPEGEYAPPPARRPRRGWAAAPATYLLVGINCGIFLAMAVRGSSIWMPTLDQLMFWGADRPNNVLVYGEWWRIVTAMFVHVGIIHLATNMWCLWNLGLLAEPLMGSFGLFAAYILTGAAGNLLSTFYNWVWPIRDATGAAYFQAGAGASGAVFGIAGVLIILLKSNRLPVPPQELRRLRKSVIYFAAINLVIGLSVNFGSGFTGVGSTTRRTSAAFSAGYSLLSHGAAHRLAAQRFWRACAWPWPRRSSCWSCSASTSPTSPHRRVEAGAAKAFLEIV